MLVKLAWRNIWRNRRRTYITIASVFFAVILSSLMMSLKEGVYVNMIDSMVGAYTGYGQVHANGYWEEKSVNNSFELNDSLDSAIKSHPDVQGYLPRIESFALASSQEITKGIMVVGLDPELEQQFAHMNDRVTQGKYFKNNDRKALLGVGLADYLKLGVGDTIVLIGQGYHGASAAGKYQIAGLVKFGSPELSKQIVFLPLKEAQWYLNAPDICTGLILQMTDGDLAPTITSDLQKKLGDDFEVMDWNTLVPELQKMIDADRVEGYIFMAILYMVISFGMFGTVVMMLAERKHEFGVLIAIGMAKIKLAIVVWLEVLFMSLLGVLFGIIGAFPVSFYFYVNPIRFGEEMAAMYEEYGMEAVLQTSLDPFIYINQGIVVFIVASVIAFYPLIHLQLIKVIDAMRS